MFPTSEKYRLIAKEKTILNITASTVIIIWTVIITGLCIWAIKNTKDQTNNLLKFQSRAFFQEIVTVRSWNASHGGVYVPVTSKTQPNLYLEDNKRDVITKSGLKLTKINPAYMTRQIGEIAEQKKIVWFHITSAKPIRPANAADQWELDALKSFASGASESSEFIKNEEKKTLFRYMAPLWVEAACLKCHSIQGYKKNELRGGISVTVLADPILAIEKDTIGKSIIAYFCIWIVGLLGIYFGYRLLKIEETRRIGIISELQESLSKVKTLSGLLPICSHCKKIRDGKGYWSQIESYIQKHSDAEFSHSICQECAKKYYPDFSI